MDTPPKERPSDDPHREKRSKKYEEEAIILDVLLPNAMNRRDKYRNKTLAQAVGTKWFTLLELILKSDATVMLQDRVPLNKEERNIVETIVGRISYEKLTPLATQQLDIAVDKIVSERESEFVDWVNKATPVSIRLHSLQLIKGIGKKSRESILQQRKIKPFESFEDIEERTEVKDLKSLIVKRIIEEISTPDEKHRLFTREEKKESFGNRQRHHQRRGPRRRGPPRN